MVALTMQPTNNFFTPRRKTAHASQPRGKRLRKTEEHLQQYLDIFDAMSEKECAEAARDAWMPPRDVIERLVDPSLLQRDRVELVIAVFSVTHPGHTPSWDELGRVLGIAGKNAFLYGKQLLQLGRAEMRDGKFCLRPAGYEHPIIRARFGHLYQLLR